MSVRRPGVIKQHKPKPKPFNIIYADDSVLIATSPVALQRLIDVCMEYLTSHNMLISVDKTRCMAILPRSLKDIHMPSFYVNGSRLTIVSKKGCLGYVMIRMTLQFKRNAELFMQEVTCFSESLRSVQLRLRNSYSSHTVHPFIVVLCGLILIRPHVKIYKLRITIFLDY